MSETIKCERMGYGSFAIGHLESGKTAFVEGAVTEDVVLCEIVEEKPSYVRAQVVSILESSPYRIDPKAQWLNTSLAPWQCLAYEQQLEEKKSALQSALKRVAHINVDVDKIIGCKRQWGYRNKLEMASVIGTTRKLELGFHETESSKLVFPETCPLAVKNIERAPKALTGCLRYLCGQGSDLGIYRVGVRASAQTSSTEVALWTPPSAFPRGFAAKSIMDAIGATSVVRVIAEEGSRRVKRTEILDGDGYWNERIPNGFEFHISAPSFFQVNTSQAAHLVDVALSFLDVSPEETVVDLYCGAGTFTLALAETGACVIGIEEAGSSTRDLRVNLDINGIDADVICDDVARALPSIGQVDALLCDPPKSGLSKEALNAMIAANPHRIVYVSCDPQTFARDAARFASSGYQLSNICAVDMFPQTYHIETVGLFRR